MCVSLRARQLYDRALTSTTSSSNESRHSARVREVHWVPKLFRGARNSL